ncbi:hypothetical protein I6L27_01860 [Acinetobacter pittii]|uniref:hypothetical protein n=1 Tax=Acinetobacter pittii TaxID=48296 RepID=UPI001C248F77|nr:hypothetical protein [Acinetobacter pittii]QXA07957.1 hypothetical protein I6L27_19210 [Acinetobacter pittii]QXA08311.1 hypothetical protein I6L27_01860 [Acinetobacter pittii]
MRTKKELLQAIDNVVERALNTQAVDMETAEFLNYIVQELDPDLHAAIRAQNAKKYSKGASHE